MDKTHLLLWALLALAACSGKEMPEPEPVAVGFTLEEGTKAGFAGEVDGNAIRATGFGVYGYVTPDSDWATSGATTKPRFMTNQHVQFEGSWTYRPLKYWPNDASDAVSFFAYAPYVSLEDVSGSSTGIISLPGKDDVGAPKVGYKTADNPAFGVDLMVGVAASVHTSPAVTAGAPFLDMTKMPVGDKMDYRFVHTLTRLCVLVDAVSASDIDWDNTRVVVESISLGDGGQALYTQGALNLASTAWESLSGRVGDLTDRMATGFRFVSGNTESVTYFTQQPLGVSETARSLFGQGVDGLSAAQLLYIPGPASEDPLSLTLAYRVIVRDVGQPFGYSYTRREVTVTPNAHFTAGQTTTLRLHLNASL